MKIDSASSISSLSSLCFLSDELSCPKTTALSAKLMLARIKSSVSNGDP